MNNLDKPAYPIHEAVELKRFEGQLGIPDFWKLENKTIGGITKREHACIQLGVPESGDEELDQLIRKSNRQKAAVKAMEGMLANGISIDIDKEYPFQTRAQTCLMIVEAVYNELEKPTEK